MRSIFYECELLESLPDISNWNTENITDMSFLFDGCCNLIIKKLDPLNPCSFTPPKTINLLL